MTKTNKVASKVLGFTVLSATILGISSFAFAEGLTRQLQMGMTGSDVGSLQVFLAKNPSIYPEGVVSNYYWTLTKAAVIRFQAQNGIATVGRVGPQTLAAINSQMGNGNNTTADVSAPVISNLNVRTTSNDVYFTWNTNENAKGVVYYKDTPITASEAQEGSSNVTVSGLSTTDNGNYLTSQNINISGLQSNTTYYYLVYVTDQNGNVTVTVPNSTFRTN